MKISTITIDGFGVWQGLQLAEFEQSPVVFYGPNEAGKTTILEFLRGMFFGLLSEDARRYLPPRETPIAGGSLEIHSRFGGVRIERRVDCSQEPWQEQLQVVTSQGTPAGPHILHTLLGNIDRAIFQNIFALGLTELQQLDALAATEAAQHLYGLTSGTDRVSLSAVLAKIVDGNRQILGESSGDPAGALSPLLEKRSSLRRQLAALVHRKRQWHQLHARRAELERQIAECCGQEPRLAADLPLDHLLPRLRQQWHRCQEIQRELASEPQREIPESAIKQLDRLAGQLQQAQERFDATGQQQQSLRQELKTLSDSEVPSADWEPLMELDRQRPSIATLDQQIARCTSQLEELEFELQGELEKHGIPAGQAPLAVDRLGRRSQRALRQPARLLVSQRRQLRQLREQAQEADARAGQLESEYREAQRQLGLSDTSGSAHRLRDRAEALRQRIALQDELERLGRQVQQSEAQLQQWNQRLIVPWRGLLVLGGIFSLGIALMLVALLGGFMGLSLGMRGHFTWIGLALSVTAMVMKKGAELLASQQSRAAQARLDHWQQQRQALVAQRDILDSRLPTAGGPWVQQLHQVQLELQQCERLAPLHAQWQQARSESQQVQRHVAQVRHRLKRAQRSWQLALRAVGLPEQLSPARVRRLVQGDPAINQIRQRYAETRKQREESLRQREQFQLQVDQYRMLLEPLGLENLSADMPLAEQVEQLAAAARKAQHQARHTLQLRRRWKKSRGERQQLEAQIEQITQQRQKVLQQLGAKNENQVRSQFQRQQQRCQMRQERDQLLAELARALQPRYTADQLAAELENGQPETLDQTLGQWHQQHTDSQSRLAELCQAQGRIDEQLKQHSADRGRSILLAQWHAVHQQLREVLDRLAADQMVATILKSVRKAYERERQPQTLTEASLYLQQLSDNRYTRVWTPLGEETLCVDRHDGRSLPLEQLSRGAREQVYLALRLALAADFGRRGTQLPMVLDDVLVNFDSSRAAGAVRAVKTYAAHGGQIVVFTCHQHIRDAFLAQGVPVRTLPQWQDGSAMHERSSAATDTPRPAPMEPPVVAPSRPARIKKRRRRRHSLRPAANWQAANAALTPPASATTIPFPQAGADAPTAPTPASRPIHFVDYDVA